MTDLLWRFLLLQLSGWAFVGFVVVGWKLFMWFQDRKPVELPKFDELAAPLIPGPYKDPWWAWPARILFWGAYVVFFTVSIPITVWLWKSGAFEGGQAFDLDEMAEEAGWSKTREDT